MHLYIYFNILFLLAIGSLLSIWFVFSDTGTYSSYLLAHVWGRRKIRSRCATTSWFTDSPIGRELPTNANGRAFATRCTTKRRYTTRFGIDGGGGTQRRVYIFVRMLCAYTSVFECGLWCNSVNKENAWCTCLPRLILFSRSVDLHRVAS